MDCMECLAAQHDFVKTISGTMGLKRLKPEIVRNPIHCWQVSFLLSITFLGSNAKPLFGFLDGELFSGQRRTTKGFTVM